MSNSNYLSKVVLETAIQEGLINEDGILKSLYDAGKSKISSLLNPKATKDLSALLWLSGKDPKAVKKIIDEVSSQTTPATEDVQWLINLFNIFGIDQKGKDALEIIRILQSESRNNSEPSKQTNVSSTEPPKPHSINTEQPKQTGEQPKPTPTKNIDQNSVQELESKIKQAEQEKEQLTKLLNKTLPKAKKAAIQKTIDKLDQNINKAKDFLYNESHYTEVLYMLLNEELYADDILKIMQRTNKTITEAQWLDNVRDAITNKGYTKEKIKGYTVANHNKKLVDLAVRLMANKLQKNIKYKLDKNKINYDDVIKAYGSSEYGRHNHATLKKAAQAIQTPTKLQQKERPKSATTAPSVQTKAEVVQPAPAPTQVQQQQPAPEPTQAQQQQPAPEPEVEQQSAVDGERAQSYLLEPLNKGNIDNEADELSASLKQANTEATEADPNELNQESGREQLNQPSAPEPAAVESEPITNPKPVEQPIQNVHQNKALESLERNKAKLGPTRYKMLQKILNNPDHKLYDNAVKSAEKDFEKENKKLEENMQPVYTII